MYPFWRLVIGTLLFSTVAFPAQAAHAYLDDSAAALLAGAHRNGMIVVGIEVGAHISVLSSTDLELALFEHANADRTSVGLAPVDYDELLVEIARTRAAAQLGQGGLSHHDGSSIALVSLLAEWGVDYNMVGENLAEWPMDDPSAAEGVQLAFMESPSHRGNILEPTFNRLAVGIAADDSGRVAIAQVFVAGR
jgi:uncharacterized protein YkwD